MAVVVQSRPTLCDPTDCGTPGLPVLHRLPEPAQTHVHRVGDAVQPSPPLSSLLLPPSVFPSIRVFSSESVSGTVSTRSDVGNVEKRQETRNHLSEQSLRPELGARAAHALRGREGTEAGPVLELVTRLGAPPGPAGSRHSHGHGGTPRMAMTSTEGQRVPPQTGQGETSRRTRAAEGEDVYCQRPACAKVQGDKAWGILQVCVGTESGRR